MRTSFAASLATGLYLILTAIEAPAQQIADGSMRLRVLGAQPRLHQLRAVDRMPIDEIAANSPNPPFAPIPSST